MLSKGFSVVEVSNSLAINASTILFQHSALHGSTADHPKHVKWEASDDKENWTTILEIEELPYSEEEQSLPCTTVVSARYLRLSIMSAWTEATWTYVGEMSIY